MIFREVKIPKGDVVKEIFLIEKKVNTTDLPRFSEVM